MLDETDIIILETVSQNPGKPLSQAIRPILETSQKAARTLYDRTKALEQLQLIQLDRISRKGAALATITPEGLEAIKGRAGTTSKGGVSA